MTTTNSTENEIIDGLMDNLSRHILRVEEDGFAKIVGHEDPTSVEQADACRRLQIAWEAFESSGEPMPAGMFYCSLGEDGNFEIGSRVP